MQRPITRGASANAGLIFHIFAQDSSATNGAGKASVAFSSWSCRYIRNGEAISGVITPEDITTIGTYAAPTANTNIRIKAVDNTNMIGIYEVQIHLDWVNTTNSCQSLTIYLTASGVAVLPIQIPLRADDIQVAKPTNSNLLSIDANGRVDVIKIAGTTQTARDIGASVLLSSGTGTGQLDFTAGVVKSNTTQLAGQTVTAAAGVTFPTSVASPTNITAGTITTVTNLTNAPSSGDFTATMKTSLNAATPAVTVSDKTGFSLTSAYDPAKTAAQAGDAMALTSGERTTLAGVIWAALVSGLVTVGSIGKRIVDFLDVAVSSRSTYDGSDTSGTTTLLSRLTSGRASNLDNLDATVSSRLATSGYTTPPTVQQVVDGVWDEPIASHLDAGSTGAALNAAGSSGDPWSTPLPGAYGAGTAGQIVGDNLDATVSSRLATAGYTAPDNASITAIKAKTDNLPGLPAAVGSAMTLTSAYDAAKTAAQPGDIPTPAENADGLLVRSLATGTDGGRTVQDALRVLRNKVTAPSGTLTVYEENDSTIAWTGVLTTNPAAEPITAVDPA